MWKKKASDTINLMVLKDKTMEEMESWSKLNSPWVTEMYVFRRGIVAAMKHPEMIFDHFTRLYIISVGNKFLLMGNKLGLFINILRINVQFDLQTLIPYCNGNSSAKG
ncbi:hypothetical protein CEXT_365351 [Caerostris extrusa]|uniref:Uncharacterized protein n=1 Tax=Caerostris extrusa TaxID=172846 RepID=A0AAV4X3N8_CAEEX|nr:hypothetical protein CEXT_365351 [Caerostris extrusa]